MSLRSRGVTKRKGAIVPKCRMTTRNRLKLDKLRESLKDLHLGERNLIVTRSKIWKPSATLCVSLHDFQGTGSTCSHAAPLGCNEIPLSGSIARTNNGGIRTLVKPHFKKVNFDHSHESELKQSKRSSATELCESDDGGSEATNFERLSHVSLWGTGSEVDFVSLSTDTVNIPKRKHDEVIFPGSFKGTRDKGPLSTSVSMGEKTHNDVWNDDNRDKFNYSPSPPNSPLYDMPPPSTLAEREERRAKRKLQLERWRKYETSKSRQERYERRARTVGNAMHSLLDSKHVQWSNNLVQTAYITDVHE